MKQLSDVREYARNKGMNEHSIERLIDEIPDVNGFITDSDFDIICGVIYCEMENIDYE